MDCDTVFQGDRCPGCSSESFFPLSRWVQPAREAETVSISKKAKKASMLLLGSGVAFAAWKFFSKPDGKSDKPASESRKREEHGSKDK